MSLRKEHDLRMSLTKRHRWCIERIINCFADKGVDDAKVHGFIRKSEVLAAFNDLFSGAGKRVIFVHFQEKNVHEVRLQLHFRVLFL